MKKCDLCNEPANYDGKTKMGPWAFMCEKHFQEHGIGLGIGKGQVIYGPVNRFDTLQKVN